MAYRLKRKERTDAGVQRILTQQVDAAIARSADHDGSTPAAIHDVRRHCKMIRGALRLVRRKGDTRLRAHERWFRDTAASLSKLRDAHVMLECFAALMQHAGVHRSARYFGIRQGLIHRRDELAARDEQSAAALAAFHESMTQARARLAGLELRGKGFALVRPGLRRIYRDGRRAMRHAYRSQSERAFHKWRRHVKNLWYACRILRPVWPPMMTVYRDTAGELGVVLGDIHDLDVLQHTLRAETNRFAALPNLADLFELIDNRRAILRASARDLGRHLYAEKPDEFTRRIEAYWSAWKRRTKPPKPLDGDDAHPADAPTPPGPTLRDSA